MEKALVNTDSTSLISAVERAGMEAVIAISSVWQVVITVASNRYTSIWTEDTMGTKLY